tara:strand:+ start:279 stop:758 length:480 start_codon:yes stop_codon:yes gene_type:complete
MTDYVINVLEEPREEFSGLPVCPFVKADRVREQLFIDVFDSDNETLVDVILRFIRSGKSSALVAQANDELSGRESREYEKFINIMIEEIVGKKNKITALVFNPNDELEVEGYNPRSKAPCLLINMAYVKDLYKAHESLQKTNYYDKMPEIYRNLLGIEL